MAAGQETQVLSPGWLARTAWSISAAVLVLAPIVLRATTTERQSFWQEMVTLSGLLACALLVVVVVLPSRVRSLTRAFGIETTMASHRTVGMTLAMLVIFHVAAVVILDPRNVGLLLPFLKPVESSTTVSPAPLLVPLMRPPLRAIAGLAATVGLVALAGVSATSPRWKGRYERWRTWHLGLAALTLVGTAMHVLLINHLVPTYQAVAWALGDPLGTAFLMSNTYFPLEAAYLGLLALIVIVAAVYRWAYRPLSRTGRYQVVDFRRESPTVFVLGLAPDRCERIRFRAGQFAWLRLHRDPFGEEHPFTITSAEQDTDLVEFTVQDTGGWASQLPGLSVGTRVWIDGPHGNFTVADHHRHPLVMIAGGVGITPMISILRTFAADGLHAAQRPVLLIIAGTVDTRLFHEELNELATWLPLTIEELDGVRISATAIADRMHPDWLRAEFYMCGSPRLIEASSAALAELQVAPECIHTEQFGV